MNEKIKDLALKTISECLFEPIHPAFEVGGGDNKISIPYIFVEKFAELIVEECRYVMD